MNSFSSRPVSPPAAETGHRSRRSLQGGDTDEGANTDGDRLCVGHEVPGDDGAAHREGQAAERYLMGKEDKYTVSAGFHDF